MIKEEVVGFSGALIWLHNFAKFLFHSQERAKRTLWTSMSAWLGSWRKSMGSNLDIATSSCHSNAFRHMKRVLCLQIWLPAGLLVVQSCSVDLNHHWCTLSIYQDHLSIYFNIKALFSYCCVALLFCGVVYLNYLNCHTVTTGVPQLWLKGLFSSMLLNHWIRSCISTFSLFQAYGFALQTLVADVAPSNHAVLCLHPSLQPWEISQLPVSSRIFQCLSQT